MDKSIRKHRKKIRNKIDNLKSTNPKEYWKVLNSRITLNECFKYSLIIVSSPEDLLFF
jgi:hypothetical protein